MSKEQVYLPAKPIVIVKLKHENNLHAYRDIRQGLQEQLPDYHVLLIIDNYQEEYLDVEVNAVAAIEEMDIKEFTEKIEKLIKDASPKPSPDY